jgi:hypothetical protein
MLKLFIANKNYSLWSSLRPWALRQPFAQRAPRPVQYGCGLCGVGSVVSQSDDCMVRTIAKNIEERPLQGVLNVSGFDGEGEDRVIEHPEHPFFVGTLFVPQAQSTSGKPHPLVAAFVKTVIGRAT